MNPPVGCLIEPGYNILVGFLDGAERVAPPELFTNIMNGTFHFPLHPGVIGRSNLRLKTIMMGKVEELDIKGSFTIFSADDHVFHVVVENLRRDSLKANRLQAVGY